MKTKTLTPSDVLNPQPQIDPKTGKRPERGYRADGKPEPLWLHDGGGLYLVDDATGRRWLFRYRVSPKKIASVGLGGAHVTTQNEAKRSLAEARDRADELRRQRKKGIDPQQSVQAAKKASTPSPTFKKVAEDYIKLNKAGWGRAHLGEAKYCLHTHAVALANIAVDEIDETHVIRVLTPLWDTKHITARRLRAHIENVLDFAKVKKLRSGENPAMWRGNLEHVLPNIRLEERHHKGIEWRKMPDLMGFLRAQNDVAARCLEFAILCGNRISEANGVTWDEINLEDKVWIVPASRIKNKKIHIIPLTDRAIELLKSCEGMPSKGPIFPGTKGQRMTPQRTARLLKRFDPTITQHGNRAAFKTWAHTHYRAQWELSEQALSHTVGTKMQRAYFGGHEVDEVRTMLEAWRAFCDGGEGAGTVSGELVTPLRPKG